ncbi:hypothetical protein HMPREF1051_1928 [Neisseria sicca VK64]|uniref:Uncharacterized protein n=1 Tax=Neisseria sicca VK64 TaxID=1095748 RepID=I2NGG8_NEISI|nr:hypothetical protein HMPREF1051_1928 [Neisseria sicca VK64]
MSRWIFDLRLGWCVRGNLSSNKKRSSETFQTTFFQQHFSGC